MKLLALDTSTDACTVALQFGDERMVEHCIAPQKHAQLLLPMIDRLLAEAACAPADLDGVAFGCGPGSFTGLRIAAATAQGIAFGADIGVIPISSLQALAQGAYRLHSVTHALACFDARMSEVYWGAYTIDDTGLAQPIIPDQVCAPENVTMPAALSHHEWAVLGSGADEYRDTLRKSLGGSVQSTFIADCWPNACDMLDLAKPIASTGAVLSAAKALPVYLRNTVALTEAQRASGERL